MRLAGRQLEQLQKALEDAFHTPAELERMVRFKLEESLYVIAGGGNLSDIIFNLIRWAESEGRVDELIKKACEVKPGNPYLRASAEQFFGKVSAKPGYDNIIETFNRLVNSQVQRFARSKYIKGLYVRRRLQSELSDFHATESELAKRLKSSTVRTISSCMSGLAQVSESLPSLSPVIEQLAQSSAGLGMKDVELPPFDQTLSQIRSVQNSICGIRNVLDKALKKANTLSDVCLLDQRPVHVDLINTLNSAVSTIREAGLPRGESENRLGSVERILLGISEIKKKLPESHVEPHSSVLEDVSKDLGVLSATSLTTIIAQTNSISDEIERARRHCTLVIDRAGGGKTSLLCELALNTAKRAPTILLFGKENYQHPESVIRRVKRIVEDALGVRETDAMKEFDGLLQSYGHFLHVFIDGINECRRIPEMDVALTSFLEWSSRHRVRVTISCRDIYWEFFDSERWEYVVFKTSKNQLYQFSQEEYSEALDLYLRRFRITCELLDAARDACQHPLLLRFFCEAYSNPDGEPVVLGTIQDIRLWELFNVYFNRKMEQIRYFLRHKNADVVSRFLLDLAERMYTTKSASIFTYEIGEITGHSDTSTQDSVYLRLLDEDIILEEKPTDQVDFRRIHFVYEEFMEYVLAKSYLLRKRRLGSKSISEIFHELAEALSEWVNARGLTEYIALMLVAEKNPIDVEQGFELMELMIKAGGIWVDAFWSVVGKLPESALEPRLFDLFYPALNATRARRVGAVRDSMGAIARLSVQGAEKLASAILWSALLPNVLRWSDLECLDNVSESELRKLAARLVKALQGSRRFDHVKVIKYDRLLNWIQPHVNEQVAKRIQESVKLRGKPGKSDFVAMMHLIRDLFPKYQGFLLNGLFHADDYVVSFCADRIRFVELGTASIVFLCKELAKAEKRGYVRELLLNSVAWMEDRPKLDRAS